ncbi:MAG: hypothetical protein ACJAWW_000960 [Sulfurimonas sp.]|jgi:hypothetical protein
MIKTLLLILTMIILNGVINASPVESKYYTNCKEYYDFQGFYHDECKETKAKIEYNNIGPKSDFIQETIRDLWANKQEPEVQKEDINETKE